MFRAIWFDIQVETMVDQSGILRVGGRLENAQIDYEAKHQILLPYNHHISCLIIMAHHELVGHFGTEYVLASLRQKYWIVKDRAMVRKVIERCLICRRYNVITHRLPMSALISPDLCTHLLNHASHSYRLTQIY